MKTLLNNSHRVARLLGLLPPLMLMGLLLFAREIRSARRPVLPASTTVLLVCHGEKAPVGTSGTPLAPAGQVRAQALADLLSQRGVAAVFTPPVPSCRATVAPLAQSIHLTPLVYNATQPSAVASRITQQYAGKTVVVVGEPATLLPLVDALGVPRPVSSVAETDHDLLLEVRLPADGFPMVLTRRYGASE
ncbi:histidine phosphatase family protein [Hymenobacter sp. CRA2]|uniref:histidine phosphatase family protein n=1 Tax=Hymenobacter sp. CRA2 TaxID=1955620 RepID=UPI00098EAA22|nr:histidine phosphatase family protein [Hymenobacter sp. CRA2]OON67226.1 hypothetical protein B0919_19050 [Hymenobacter sp. CRA2]